MVMMPEHMLFFIIWKISFEGTSDKNNLSQNSHVILCAVVILKILSRMKYPGMAETKFYVLLLMWIFSIQNLFLSLWMRPKVQAWWISMSIIGLETNCKEEWEFSYFTGDCKALRVNDENLCILLYVKTIIVKTGRKYLFAKIIELLRKVGVMTEYR